MIDKQKNKDKEENKTKKEKQNQVKWQWSIYHKENSRKKEDKWTDWKTFELAEKIQKWVREINPITKKYDGIIDKKAKK